MLGFGAISEVAISALPTSLRALFSGAVTYTAIESDDVKLYAATEEYISRLADAPSGQPFRGSLIGLPRFDRSIIGGSGFDGLTNGWGNATLINAERTYDAFVAGYAVDGRDAVFKIFDPTRPYNEGFPAANIVATRITVDDQVMTIGFQDKGFKLSVQTQPNAYQGTGDLEGGTELAGKRKPLRFGLCKNVTPVLLISGELVLQANDGAVSAISAVYDQGYPLTATSDYATPALLRAATIADGSYGTCIAYGLLRAGGAFTQLTCDVTGTVSTTGTIIRRIIALTGALVDPVEIDTVSFANIEVTQGASIAYSLDENSTETVAQTFDKLSKGIGAFCGFSRLGLLQINVFTAPSGSPIGEYSDLEVLSIDIESLPSSFDPPPYRQRVIYDRNWTVIDNPVAGVALLDTDRAAWIRTPYRLASTSDADKLAILDDHLQAQDPNIVESYFVNTADALSEANRRLTLANSEYRLYRILLKVHPFSHDICQTIRLTMDKLQFDDGKLLRIPAISDIPEDNTVELRVFG